MSEPPRPPPPIVGKVTHHSVELYWDDALAAANDSNTRGDGRVRVCIQEQDSRNNTWGNVYTGYAKKHVLDGLEPLNQYTYRMRFMNDHGNSEWSPLVSVSTIKEPLTGEHLHKAVLMNDVDGAERILDTGEVNIEVTDKYGFTSLMQASQKGYTDVMEVLIHNGADIDAQNDAGKTALMLSCFGGKLHAVQVLRENGARYDMRDKGGSAPLHWAVDGANTELIEWMLDDGAEVDFKDKSSGWTPLLRNAAVKGDKNVAKLLVKEGADINARDIDGKTPLMIAVINGHHALVEVLLENKADLSVKNEFGKTIYEMAQTMEKRRVLRTLEEHMERLGISR